MGLVEDAGMSKQNLISSQILQSKQNLTSSQILQSKQNLISSQILQSDIFERRIEREGADGQLSFVFVLKPGDQPDQEPVPPVLD